jgi:hypothetical protein
MTRWQAGVHGTAASGVTRAAASGTGAASGGDSSGAFMAS